MTSPLITTVALVASVFACGATCRAGEAVFRDDFDRRNAESVGNDWTTKGTIVLQDGAALFKSKEEEFRPRLRHTFPVQRKGRLTASFEMNWLRENEGTWGLYMQLANSTEIPRFLIREADLAKGVRVNLAWGGGDQVDSRPAGSFGFYKDGKFTALRVLNDAKVEQSIVESAVVTIDVDLDARSYRVKLDGKTYENLPLESEGPIDTIRFIANGCSATGFSKSSIDNVMVTKGD